MSVSVDLFTELKVNGRWVCIDPWIIYSGEDIAHRDVKHLLPLLSGGSAVYWIVRDIEMTALKPRDLSGTLQAELHLGDDDRVYGIPGYYFASRDFDVPEYCGYFPRQEVLSLRNDPGYEVNTDEFLPVQQYRPSVWGFCHVAEIRCIRQGLRLFRGRHDHREGRRVDQVHECEVCGRPVRIEP